METEETTYKALHRMLGIHEYLNSERAPGLESLARKFSVSTKTIQRDIAFMKKEMNLPVEYSRELKGYRYTEEVIDMPAMKLSRQEVFALLVARSSIEQYQGSAFEDPLKSFFTKLLAHLAPLDLSNMKNIHRHVSYLPNGVSTTSYEDLELLGKACRDSREVEVNYRAASSGKKGKAHSSPPPSIQPWRKLVPSRVLIEIRHRRMLPACPHGKKDQAGKTLPSVRTLRPTSRTGICIRRIFWFREAPGQSYI
jgi:hypothetical protein